MVADGPSPGPIRRLAETALSLRERAGL